MRLIFAVVSLAVVTLSYANKCPLVTDPKAPVWQNWGQYQTQVNQAIAALSKVSLPPSVSRCFASADIALGDLAGVYMDGNCRRTIQEAMPNFNIFSRDTTLDPKYKEIVDKFSTLFGSTSTTLYSNIQSFVTWTSAQNAKFSSSICSNVRSNLVPCAKSSLVDLLFNSMFSNECCKDFAKDFKTLYTGYDLTEKNIIKVIVDVVNVGCTIQAPGFYSKDQTCYYSHAHNVFNKNFFSNLKAVLSLREETACDSVNGKPFKTYSSNTTHHFPNGIGCCAKSIDNAFNVIRNFPLVSQFLPSDVTAPGKCVKATTIPFLQKIMEYVPDVAKPVVEEFLGDLCLHFPLGFSNSCQYGKSTCDSLK